MKLGLEGDISIFHLILFKNFKLIFICQNIPSNLEFILSIIFIIFLNIHHIKT